MEATAIYDWLMDGGCDTIRDPFDAHVLASVLAVAMVETKARGVCLSEGTGLPAATHISIMTMAFPHALPLVDLHAESTDLKVPDDEHCLRDLLTRSATQRTPFQIHLAAIIARRSMRPNHLWQDLGLRNRAELSALMNKHFQLLASRNVNNMKWKKFFYRMICRDEGFRLCTAPSCAECDDFTVCFGEESGESLLARNRRESELYAIAAVQA
jgi:nitrogen fixation protein NifQ